MESCAGELFQHLGGAYGYIDRAKLAERNRRCRRGYPALRYQTRAATLFERARGYESWSWTHLESRSSTRGEAFKLAAHATLRHQAVFVPVLRWFPRSSTPFAHMVLGLAHGPCWAHSSRSATGPSWTIRVKVAVKINHWYDKIPQGLITYLDKINLILSDTCLVDKIVNRVVNNSLPCPPLPATIPPPGSLDFISTSGQV